MISCAVPSVSGFRISLSSGMLTPVRVIRARAKLLISFFELVVWLLCARYFLRLSDLITCIIATVSNIGEGQGARQAAEVSVIVLKTNVVCEARRPEPHSAVRRWLNDQGGETLYLSSVTLAELLFGIAVLPAGKRKHQSWYCHTRSRRQHIALLPEMIKISKGLSGSSLRNPQRLGP